MTDDGGFPGACRCCWTFPTWGKEAFSCSTEDDGGLVARKEEGSEEGFVTDAIPASSILMKSFSVTAVASVDAASADEEDWATVTAMRADRGRDGPIADRAMRKAPTGLRRAPRPRPAGNIWAILREAARAAMMARPRAETFWPTASNYANQDEEGVCGGGGS